MHDIDRTQLETWETGFETGSETALETDSNEFDGSPMFEGPLNEVQEMELASELLEITSEEELEQFLGSLFKTVSRGVGSFMRGPLGRSLGGMLKGIAKKVLPLAGGALGSFIPIPGVGTAVGTALGIGSIQSLRDGARRAESRGSGIRSRAPVREACK